VEETGHIFTSTGAKGLTSAISDVTQFAEAFVACSANDETLLGRESGSDSEIGLARQWRVQQFSRWMTEMLHTSLGDLQSGAFNSRSQLGQFAYVNHSPFAQCMLAERHIGLIFFKDRGHHESPIHPGTGVARQNGIPAEVEAIWRTHDRERSRVRPRGLLRPAARPVRPSTIRTSLASPQQAATASCMAFGNEPAPKRSENNSDEPGTDDVTEPDARTLCTSGAINP
jgi:hypothetical protein